MLTIHYNRMRNIAVTYDNEGGEVRYKNVRSQQREERTTWQRVYGIERVPHEGQIGLIGKHQLILNYPHMKRCLKYQDIASVDLVEDPNKPVINNVRRIRVNLKGRSKHYHISEFPGQAVSIHQRINQRFNAELPTGSIRAQGARV